MAALRSALVMLRRRGCGSSGSSAAASMVGIGGREVHQFPRTSARSLLLLRPTARNFQLQGLHHFSTGGTGCGDQKKLFLMKHKAENIIQLWWQRSCEHVKNHQSSNDPYNCRSIRVYGTIGFLAVMSYLVIIFRAIHLHDVSRRTNSNTGTQRAAPSIFPYYMLPGYRHMHFYALGDNFMSKRRPTTQMNRSSSLKQASSLA